MEQNKIERLIATMPDILKSTYEIVKQYLAENAREVLSGATGVVGCLIKLFAADLVDVYFRRITQEKLNNFGIKTYLSAAFKQARSTLEVLIREGHLDGRGNTLSVEQMTAIIDDKIKLFEIQCNYLAFFENRHPAIRFVQDVVCGILDKALVSEEAHSQFLKHYYENIENAVRGEFGQAYEQHKIDIENGWMRKTEESLLVDMVGFSNIGFDKKEKLVYETTYGQWENVENFRGRKNELEENEYDALQEVTTLIEEYFSDKSEHIEKILFIVADFGKGKSVFLRNYASTLAKSYLKTHDGLFPVYFNLRDYGNTSYSTESRLGVVSNYLAVKYGIDIEDEYFKRKNFIFLVDSLDESGELNQANIDRVLDSVKKIQRLDEIKCRNNRIIITSRPIEDGLLKHLSQHKPKEKEVNKIKISYFISIYGFKVEQFNHWLNDSVKKYFSSVEINLTGFAKDIVDNIIAEDGYDVHSYLLENKILSRSELRRPLFAYMLYQLICKNINIASAGKIGIYLSFINLLTMEAKHKEDQTCRTNLKEEFVARNILHAIAALWNYKRSNGGQGVLKKDEICQVIECKCLDASEDLAHSKNISNYKFLSHSYFGENNNCLHFQHQSFAEILLAEYYLKIFIKFAFEEEVDIDSVRKMFVIGEPTEQCMLFFRDYLQLLRDVSSEEPSEAREAKREMLVPLLSSLSTREMNKKLHSEAIKYEWFLKIFDEDRCQYRNNLQIASWPINSKAINSVISLAERILVSRNIYALCHVKQVTSLYDEEGICINRPLKELSFGIDKWISLVVGNLLYNDIPSKRFFNERLKEKAAVLFELIKEWNFSFDSPTPNWGKDLFRGINYPIESEMLRFSVLNFSGVDFSYSRLANIVFSWCHCIETNFDYVAFNNVAFEFSRLWLATFHKASFESVRISDSEVGLRFVLPKILLKSLDMSYSFFEEPLKISLQGSPRVPKERWESFIDHSVRGLGPIILHAINNNVISVNNLDKLFKRPKSAYYKEFLSCLFEYIKNNGIQN